MIGVKFGYDIKQLKAKMGALEREVIPFVRSTALSIAEKAHEMVAHFTYSETRTEGAKRLADMWMISKRRRASVEEYIIRNTYPNQDVILFFEEGTSSHLIRPVKKSILRWIDPESGKEIFARSVDHPGTKAHYMVARTHKLVGDMMDVYIQKTFQMVDRIMRR